MKIDTIATIPQISLTLATHADPSTGLASTDVSATSGSGNGKTSSTSTQGTTPSFDAVLNSVIQSSTATPTKSGKSAEHHSEKKKPSGQKSAASDPATPQTTSAAATVSQTVPASPAKTDHTPNTTASSNTPRVDSHGVPMSKPSAAQVQKPDTKATPKQGEDNKATDKAAQQPISPQPTSPPAPVVPADSQAPSTAVPTSPEQPPTAPATSQPDSVPSSTPATSAVIEQVLQQTLPVKAETPSPTVETKSDRKDRVPTQTAKLPQIPAASSAAPQNSENVAPATQTSTDSTAETSNVAPSPLVTETASVLQKKQTRVSESSSGDAPASGNDQPLLSSDVDLNPSGTSDAASNSAGNQTTTIPIPVADKAGFSRLEIFQMAMQSQGTGTIQDTPSSANLAAWANSQFTLSMSGSGQGPGQNSSHLNGDTAHDLLAMSSSSPAGTQDGSNAASLSTPFAANPQASLIPTSVGNLSSHVSDAIVQRLDTLTATGHTNIVLRLDPPELGKVNVHVALANDTISIRMVVPDEATRQVVDRQINDLRQSLSDQGISLGQCNVESDSGSRQSFDRGMQQQQIDNTNPYSTSTRRMGFNQPTTSSAAVWSRTQLNYVA